MDEFQYRKEVDEAIAAADNALFHLSSASQCLTSAGNWGIVDLLGGGFISTLAKHSKLDDAKRELENAKRAVLNLQKEMQDINQLENINIDTGDFLTFADFFFDGVVADWLVQSKIRDAQKQLDSAYAKVSQIKNRLLCCR